ncbi:hypothetical protein [Rhodococcus qingshengii]|uniref:hypothetical protein n=1 Tax=Rhodococcus qingshengii TaxID=334542 RepID=UPI0036DB00FE
MAKLDGRELSAFARLLVESAEMTLRVAFDEWAPRIDAGDDDHVEIYRTTRADLRRLSTGTCSVSRGSSSPDPPGTNGVPGDGHSCGEDGHRRSSVGRPVHRGNPSLRIVDGGGGPIEIAHQHPAPGKSTTSTSPAIT